jgi:hypothetical protein
MDLERTEADFSCGIGSGRAEPLELTWVRFRAPWIALEVGGRTTPESPKSLAACLLFVIVAIMGLTSGLGGLVRWLGGPLWACLGAAGVGLAISTVLGAAFAMSVSPRVGGRRPATSRRPIALTATTPCHGGRQSQPADDLTLGLRPGRSRPVETGAVRQRSQGGTSLFACRYNCHGPTCESAPRAEHQRRGVRRNG